MQRTTTYCDICGEETVVGYAIDIKWCNDREYQRFDLCKNCKNEANSNVNEEEKDDYSTKELSFLGVLRLFFSNKKFK